MRTFRSTARARRAAVIGTVLLTSVIGTAGPAAADCDLADVGRTGVAPSGTTVLVDGAYRLCLGDQWVG